MHSIDWKVECRNLCLLFIIGALIGWWLDLLPWMLLLASISYVGWSLLQLQRIQNWLADSQDNEPPYSKGLWGDIFDGIYRLQRQNVEERLRLQAAVDYLQDSFASLDDAAVMISQQGMIEWSNRAAEKLLGLRYPQDRHQQLQNLIRVPDFIRYFEQADYQQPMNIESPFNKHYQLQITITFFGEGSRLLFARDITEFHRMQEMRKDFVANVSHELRTPLTVINGYLHTFADTGVTSERQWRTAVEQMLEQSGRMAQLISDLIVLAKLESVPEASVHESVDISSLIGAVREEVLAVFSDHRQIDIKADPLLRIEGSRNELRSAISNLVMNAAKYSGQNGRITIRWFADQRYAYLEVEDNGVGIDEIHIPRLTERFYRVDNSRSIDTGGSGLGLAIVKHILIRHRAELRVSSEPGKGSCFTCVFPRGAIH